MQTRKQTQTARRRLPIVLAALLLLAAGGAVDGYFSHRWISTETLAEASAAIKGIPTTIGEWESIENEIPVEHLKIAGATGSLSRTYTNPRTGDRISVMSLCGPHGPISLHPPTVCFTSAGWNLASEPNSQDYTVAGNSNCRFWQTTFSRPSEFEDETIVTDWGWNRGDGWKASAEPRFEFAGSPYLFKLYFTSSQPDDSEAMQRRKEFIQQFVEEFERTVFQKLAANQS